MAPGAGVPLQSPALPTPGDTICGEIVLEHLASVSLGAEVFQPVFAARHLGRDEPLWLTVIDGMFTPTSVDLSSFMAGANGLLGVRHPSLVRVVLVDREEDYCVVGYERLPGAEALGDLVVRGDSRRVLARAAVEVARGLAYLHRRGLLHGALTPGTVLLWEGVPVLWEHGLAALCDPTVFGPRSRSLGGDVVAPEVPSGAPLTPAADVYAWGAVMASVASGELGAQGVTAVLEGDVDPGRHGLLLGVVRQALAPEPGRRPRDGVHLLELLQRALASTDPNTELDPSEKQAHEGGDDALRELAGRYLAEVGGAEGGAGGRGHAAVAPAPALGRGVPPVRPRASQPPQSGQGFVRGPAPGGAGVDAGSLSTGPAEPVARWASRAPEASASGWLRPAVPRAADGGKGRLFDKPRLAYIEHPHGVRRRSLLSPAAAAAPPRDQPPPRRIGVPQPVEQEDTPPEGLGGGRGSRDHHRDHRDEGLRGLDALELLTGNIPQSERETPYDMPIVEAPPPRASKRGGGRRVNAREADPPIEPDLPDILEEHELPPMPEPEHPPAAAAASMPGRSTAREPFRVPRTPGPHGPPKVLMATVLAVLCGAVAVAATLAASSARGGFARMLGGEARDAVVADGGGAGASNDEAAAAAAGPCPPGMAEIRAEPEPFCIDRAEYPGLDQVPAVDVDQAHAEQACTVRGHALCTAAQWDRACRGGADWPYPYGPKREAGRCRVGDETAAPGPSGADPHCVTPEGVLDLVGNVAEWTAEGVVKGGSVRSPKSSSCATDQRLKPTAQNAMVGFRCCTPLAAGEVGAGPG